MEAPPAGVDDMTKLSYLHEPGVIQNLRTRYELNEIYVSIATCLQHYTPLPSQNKKITALETFIIVQEGKSLSPSTRSRDYT